MTCSIGTCNAISSITAVKILYIPTKRTELVVNPTNHDRPSGYPGKFDHVAKMN